MTQPPLSLRGGSGSKWASAGWAVYTLEAFGGDPHDQRVNTITRSAWMEKQNGAQQWREPVRLKGLSEKTIPGARGRAHL